MNEDSTNPGGIEVSIVVPAYNEEEVLGEFHRRISLVMAAMDVTWEVIYVNDGSHDHTATVIDQLQAGDGHVGLIDLSRNFGKEIALTAGLDAARGNTVVVIDADLQDPPELIPELHAQYRNGYDVVYARRTTRAGESFVKKFTASAFYRVIQSLSRVSIPRDTGDFRLLSRRANDALKTLREQHRFMKGLFAWIGFPQIAVDYHRNPRFAGNTKWNYWKLWNFALEGITSFSIAPLKVATYTGALIAALAFVYAIVIVSKTLFFGDPVRGYASMMVTMLFLGGVQIMFIGVLGEYLGRMFDEVKQRPLYIVKSHHPSLHGSGMTRAIDLPTRSLSNDHEA